MARDLLYLSRGDVEALGLSLHDVVAAVEDVLAAKGRGEVESPPKRGLVPEPGCSLRAMKAYLPAQRAAGVKWISAFPRNGARGQPTISGLIVLNDVDDGVPLAVMDATWITAARTAACTLVSARRLARQDSRTLGVVACGVQGRMNLAALCTHFPVRDVKAYDKREAAAQAFAEEMSARHGVAVSVVGSAEEAAREVDLLVTSLPIERRPRPPIGPDVLAPGAFAALLDYHSALTVPALRQVDKIVVDDDPQLRFFRSIGYFRNVPEPDGDLGKVVAGRQRGRDDERQRIVALNLGIGVLDIATAALVHRRALAAGLGARLPL